MGPDQLGAELCINGTFLLSKRCCNVTTTKSVCWSNTNSDYVMMLDQNNFVGRLPEIENYKCIKNSTCGSSSPYSCPQDKIDSCVEGFCIDIHPVEIDKFICLSLSNDTSLERVTKEPNS